MLLLLSLAKIPSTFIFIAFQLTRVGGSNRLLTVKTSGLLFNFSSDGVLARHNSPQCLCRVISTRRFFWRPSGSSLPLGFLFGAIGLVSPKPRAVIGFEAQIGRAHV